MLVADIRGATGAIQAERYKDVVKGHGCGGRISTSSPHFLHIPGFY